jgi:very-short-patch-repair endonuclease
VSKSELETALYLQLEDLVPLREFRFHPTRKWQADFAFIKEKLIIEIEGGIFSGGRHTTGTGMVADMEKYNQMAILGWTLLRYSGREIKNGVAAAEIRKYLNDKNDITR